MEAGATLESPVVEDYVSSRSEEGNSSATACAYSDTVFAQSPTSSSEDIEDPVEIHFQNRFLIKDNSNHCRKSDRQQPFILRGAYSKPFTLSE